jgi:hypothetical protein
MLAVPVWSAQARRGRALLQWHEELREKELAKAKPVSLDTKKRVDATLARPVRACSRASARRPSCAEALTRARRTS